MKIAAADYSQDSVVAHEPCQAGRKSIWRRVDIEAKAAHLLIELGLTAARHTRHTRHTRHIG